MRMVPVLDNLASMVQYVGDRVNVLETKRTEKQYIYKTMHLSKDKLVNELNYQGVSGWRAINWEPDGEGIIVYFERELNFTE